MFTTISLIKRKSDCAALTFQEQWRRHYASLVGKIPGFLACDHDIVPERVVGNGADAGAVATVDGFLQLRFESQQAWQDCIQADAVKMLRVAEADKQVFRVGTS